MNKEIELLNKKIEAQDKIINEQVLEIADLREETEKLTALWLESQNKKREAIEYINKTQMPEGYKKMLLILLGDKEK